MLSSYPALQVFLPLLAAPLCVLLSRFGKFAWLIAFGVTLAVAGMSFLTFAHILSTGEVMTYRMGGWPPPFGIEYRIDHLSATIMLLVSSMAAFLAPSMFKSISEELAREQRPYFYAAFLLCLTGLLGIVATNDAFNLYVFLEISSLSSYVLIALGKDRRALSAAFQYLMLGTIGATFLLIGVGFLYIMTGTLNISDLAERIPDLADTRPVKAAFAFITVGLCLKVALFPLHMWLPNAYAFAPSSVSAFLAAVATKVGLYALIRFFFTLFGYELAFDTMQMSLVLAALSAAAILVGSLVAMFEVNVKRILAYSSIAQIGYITLGISLGSQAGISAAIVHIINHALIKGGMFMALACLAYRLGSRLNLENIRGMGRHFPISSFAFVVAGLGLIGVPLTAGFISKWQLLTATAEEGWWVMIAVIFISSLMAVFYVWRIIEALYFGEPLEKFDQKVEAPASMVLPLLALIAVTVWFGVDTHWNLGVAESVAASLLGEAQPLEMPDLADGTWESEVHL